MSNIPDDVPPDYYDDPSKHPTTLSFESAYQEDHHEIVLCTALTMFIHGITEHRRHSKAKRSGKPEAPLQIAYRLSQSMQPLFGDIATETFSSSVTSDKSSGCSTYYLYVSDFWQRKSCVNHSIQPSFTLPRRMVTTAISSASTNVVVHPLRAPHPSEGSIIYQRFVPTFKTSFSLRVASIQDNLQDFSTWHNSDRVNAFWGQRGTVAEHEKYLRGQLADPHVTPVFAYFGDTAFAYFEVYYAKEDPIGRYADAGDYDVGWHALVGTRDNFRGPERVRVWVSSVTHYLFLLDDRVERVMLEPRVDNDKFIGYLIAGGYGVEKEFNFPHKRAALVSISREKFFETQGVAT